MATESDPLRAGPGGGLTAPTVADVRSAAQAMLRWCDDDTAERQVLGSILIPLLPEVAACVRAEARPQANLQPGGREVEDFDGRLVETRFTPAELAAHDAAIRARAAGATQRQIERLHAIMEAAIVRGGYRGDEELQVAALLAERDQRVRAEAEAEAESEALAAVVELKRAAGERLNAKYTVRDHSRVDDYLAAEQAIRLRFIHLAAGSVPAATPPADRQQWLRDLAALANEDGEPGIVGWLNAVEDGEFNQAAQPDPLRVLLAEDSTPRWLTWVLSNPGDTVGARQDGESAQQWAARAVLAALRDVANGSGATSGQNERPPVEVANHG